MDVTQQEERERIMAELGPPLAQFSVSRHSVLVCSVTTLGCFLGAAVIKIAGVPGTESQATMLVIVGLFSGIRVWYNLGLRVLIFREGLIRLHRSRMQAILWREIETVWIAVSEGPLEWGARAVYGRLRLVLLGPNGAKLTFDHVSDVEQLSDIVQRATLEHLWPRYWSIFKQGGLIGFGDLKVCRKGLVYQGQTLPWAAVARVEINKTMVRAFAKGKWWSWFKGKTKTIPNIHVLRAILQTMVTPGVLIERERDLRGA